MKSIETSLSYLLENKKEQKKKFYGRLVPEDIIRYLYGIKKVVFCEFLETECGVVLEIENYWRTIKIGPTHVIISTAIPQ